MRKISFFLVLYTILALFLTIPCANAAAAKQEKLLVCGSCSSSFIETATALIEEMGISDRVTVKKSSCLGPCSAPPVIEFRGNVYTRMTKEKLKSMLEYELNL